VHDGRSIRLSLLAALAVAAIASLAVAAPRCEQPCKAETATCIRSRCGDVEGEARRQCVETCRGIGGCAKIRTLAYVMNECRTDGPIFHQTLLVRHGNCAPVTVMDLALPVAPDQLELFNSLCRRYVDTKFGPVGSLVGMFQRLAATPDGSGVVFEVTDAVAPKAVSLFSLPRGMEKGFYFVRDDGTGLRWLSPPSEVPIIVIFPDSTNPVGFDSGGTTVPNSGISPDSRTFVFTDLGPGPAGETAIQVVTLDIATGNRTWVTRFPVTEKPPPQGNAYTAYPRFVDNDTILVSSTANPNGLNPDGYQTGFVINTDGTGLRILATPFPPAGGRVDPRFVVAGGGTNLINLESSDGTYQEIFIIDGKRLLQLTDFRRQDTSRVFLTPDGRRAFLRASADPLGTNPSGTCQLFSIDTLGAHLRQVTHFREGEPFAAGQESPNSSNFCDSWGALPALPGCSIGEAYQDPVTRTAVFYSSCNPFGTNPYGGQVFAIQPDGSQLRQLTSARGRVIEDNGEFTVELPGPITYSARPH
jgi:hypothetical protein